MRTALLAPFDPSTDFIYPAIEIVGVGAIAIAMLLLAVRLMERFLPFSVRHEIEEDHNVAAAIVMGAIILGLAMVIAAVVKE
jgi:putative membrane protein